MGKVISLAEAKRIRQRMRRRGRVAVFTNGVFDLLHVGHVRYLQAARTLGHALFVGLNSDASARRLKGLGRPLIAQAERAEILCALSCIDYVIFFDEDTAEQLIHALQPDIYVKGGDYAIEGAGQPGKMLPEARIVEDYGGRVVILPYTPGHSTSQLIARIREQSSAER
nr:D-glycero-beta-D-manno-heptose 1-phosphate adenylyltransferase [Chloroflexota bacterium]